MVKTKTYKAPYEEKPKETKANEIPSSTPAPVTIPGVTAPPSNPLNIEKPKKEVPMVTDVPTQSPAPQAATNQAPPGNIRTEVKFNPDSTVDYSAGGKTTRLTRKEYNDFLNTLGGKRGGNLTPRVRAAQDQREAALNPIPLTTIPTTDELGKAGQEPNFFQMDPLSKERLKATPGVLLSAGALAIDTIRSGITGKKPLKQQQAETIFSDTTNALNQDIEGVKMGGDPTQAIRNLELAAASLNRLERSSKAEGKLNLRYWVDNGRELDAQIALEKSILERMRNELVQAELQGNLLRARGNI